MKKLLVLLTLCLLLTGCSKEKEEVIEEPTGGTVGVIFDHKEYETIEEMNEAAGTNIVSAAVAGKSDETFGVISGNLAQYKFKVNGEEWCIRASKDIENDISGLYYDNFTFEKNQEFVGYNDDVYMHRFFFNDIQYVIILDVKDKEISMSYFDNACGDLMTNITGIKQGYEVEVLEEGNNVIYRTTYFGESETIMETIYEFKNDKMVSIVSKTIFATEQEAKDYYNLLIESGKSKDELKLKGKELSSSMNGNLDFYSDYTKDEFYKMMEASKNN